MSSIDPTAPQIVSRPEQPPAVRRRPGWNARRALQVRAFMNSDFQTLVKPEDVARGEVFINSTCCWI